MPRTLIIGYGNTLRGDDAVGYLAAERLQELIQDPEVEILALRQLTPELMEPISRAGRVIFIDAWVDGEPGTITVTAVAADAAWSPAFTHFATPAALLAGARKLYGKAPPAVLICIAGRNFGIGDWLSVPVQCALETLVQSRVIASFRPTKARPRLLLSTLTQRPAPSASSRPTRASVPYRCKTPA